MNRTTIISSLGALALAAGSGLAMAPAAFAESATASTDCSAAQSNWFTFNPGDTLTITTGGTCNQLAGGVPTLGTITYGPTGTENSVALNDWSTITAGDIAIYTAPSVACGASNVDGVYVQRSTTPANQSTYTVTTNGAACAEGPADVIQHVGLDPDGDCVFDDSPHNIGGATTGGWGRSWAQWVNNGQGGAVCVRTLTYSANHGHFIVAH